MESEVVPELDWESLAFDGSVLDETDAKCSLNEETENVIEWEEDGA